MDKDGDRSGQGSSMREKIEKSKGKKIQTSQINPSKPTTTPPDKNIIEAQSLKMLDKTANDIDELDFRKLGYVAKKVVEIPHISK